MPSYLSGRVTRILSERPGLQRVEVLLHGEDELSRAVNYPTATGSVAPGDEVVCNTTAVELGLGTGGWHFVHWNLSRRSWLYGSGGHIMKLRYTPAQLDVHAIEEEGSLLQQELLDADSVSGMPVVVASLHSLVAPIAAGLKSVAPAAKVCYIMTDGAALPMAMSDLVVALRAAGLVDVTATAGNAFGGDLDCVNVASALLAARLSGCDAAVVAMGPGVVGTSTKFGSTAWEVAGILDTALAVSARPVVSLRASFADFRARHQGVSHHTITALTYGGRGVPGRRPVSVVVPAVGGDVEARLLAELGDAGIPDRYDVVTVSPGSSLSLLREGGVEAKSMGRGLEDDPVFWQAGAAAGVHAGRILAP